MIDMNRNYFKIGLKYNCNKFDFDHINESYELIPEEFDFEEKMFYGKLRVYSCDWMNYRREGNVKFKKEYNVCFPNKKAYVMCHEIDTIGDISFDIKKKDLIFTTIEFDE